MVSRDRFLAEVLREMTRGPLGHATCVDEDQRGAMLADQFGEPVVDQFPRFIGHHRFERHRRNLQREVAGAHVADVDDRAVNWRFARDARAAYQKTGDGLDRLLCGGQADARQAPATERVEPFETERQVAAALAARKRMNLVDDHGACGGQHAAARVRAEQYIERFRRRHENVRRAFLQRVALLLRSVARAHSRADVERRQAALREFRGDAFQRYLQVETNVIGERLERRHVDHQRFVGQHTAVGEALLDELVERGQKRGEGLAGAGRCSDQRRAPAADAWPCGELGVGGRRERLQKPACDCRMKVVQHAARGRGGSHAAVDGGATGHIQRGGA
jgi:hypothetical protein